MGSWSIPREQLGSAWTPSLNLWLYSHRPTSPLVPQGPTNTWLSCRRAANPLVLTPQRVLPHIRVGPSITPPQIRPCSSTSTGPAALHPLQYGTIPARLSQRCITGSAAAVGGGGGDHPVGTHMGPRSSQGEPGGSPKAKGPDQTWASLGLSCSRCWGQQGLGGPCSGMSQPVLLCSAEDEQPILSRVSPALCQPQGKEQNLARSPSSELAGDRGKPNPAPQEENKQRFQCTSKEKKKKTKRYLNKTALSLFWALAQTLLLGDCCAPP